MKSQHTHTYTHRGRTVENHLHFWHSALVALFCRPGFIDSAQLLEPPKHIFALIVCVFVYWHFTKLFYITVFAIFVLAVLLYFVIFNYFLPLNERRQKHNFLLSSNRHKIMLKAIGGNDDIRENKSKLPIHREKCGSWIDRKHCVALTVLCCVMCICVCVCDNIVFWFISN
jgi:hypothetical protein